MNLIELLENQRPVTSETLREAISNLEARKEEMTAQEAELYEELMDAQTIALSGTAPSNLKTLQAKQADLFQKKNAAARSLDRLHVLLKESEVRDATDRLKVIDFEMRKLREERSFEWLSIMTDLADVGSRITSISDVLASNFFRGTYHFLNAEDQAKLRHSMKTTPPRETVEARIDQLDKETARLRNFVM